MTLRGILVACVLGVAAWPAWAGKMVVPEHIQGPDIGLYNGDYVSESAGLDTYYSYFIEVPPGTGKLRIRIFDADIGNGGSGDAWDLIQGSPSTRVRYTVINPGGTIKKDETLDPGDCPSGHPGCDDSWISFYDKKNPWPGHWELRIDQSSAVQSGNGDADDINVLRVRVVDPTNGVELNLYTHSYSAFGNSTGGAGTVTYHLYPWVTCGCEADSNDFDADVGNTGSSQTIATRSGNTSWTETTSGATTWLNTPLSGFTTDSDAVDYGLWDLTYNLVTTSSFPVNWATYSFGAWNAAEPSGSGPPPSAQPEAHTLRVYYPTNAGDKPVKEYMEQMVRWTSGPNPPQVGQQSVFTVTVRIVNPTPYPIEFSSSDTVTAWIPGGAAVYNGNLQIAQGSVVSEPALGSSGDVVWNPGMVDAGDTVIMAYQVAVTPTSSGQRVPVTGSPGNHGTTATYVDGTCAGQGCTGNRLAGATYTTGELCGLAVTENQLTHVALAGFRVLDDDGEAVVEWRTGSEDGTLGFRLYQEGAGGQRTPVVPGMIPSFLGAARGGTYRVRTGHAPISGTVYWLEELEAGGRRIWYGPLRAKPQPAAARGSGWPTAERRWSRVPKPASTAPRVISNEGTEPWRRHASALAIGVRTSGMYRVDAQDIARVAGVSARLVQRLIRSGRLRLTNRGQPVAWAADERGRDIVFYGKGINSLFTRDNVYVVRLGDRSGRIPTGAPPAAAPDADDAFTAHIHAEEDRLPATVLGLNPESDYWFWDYLLAGSSGLDHRNFPLTAPHPLDGQARLTVRFQGASDTGSGAHLAQVQVNGVTVGATSWEGFAAHAATFDFDTALLSPDGGNTVTIYDAGTPGVSLFFVDAFDLDYPRAYLVDGEQLRFNGPAGKTVLLQGSGTAGAVVYGISNPLKPVRLPTSTTAGGLAVTVPGGPCVAVPAGAYLKPSSMRAVTAEDPLTEPAEYLVVTPASLAGAAQILARFHEQRGLSARVVTLESIMDSFSHSIFDPHAIRNFLRSAYQRWRPRPRFVVLLGPGTLDYRNLLGYGGNLTPPLLLQTAEGLYASDALYTDFNGDGVPEIPIGRVPFTQEKQVTAWLTRVEAWEAGQAPSTVVVVSDNRDRGSNFTADAAFVTSTLSGGFDRQFLSLDNENVAALRASLFKKLAQGASMLQYFGHGGSDRMADEGILTLTDMNGSLSPGFPSLVTAFTCALNRFELPGYPCLGAGLIDPNGGGMAAVWAPSGLTNRGDLRALGRRVEEALTGSSRGTLGERLVEGLLRFRAPGRDISKVRLLFNLLGDPAMRVTFPKPAAPAGGGPADGSGARIERTARK